MQVGYTALNLERVCHVTRSQICIITRVRIYVGIIRTTIWPNNIPNIIILFGQILYNNSRNALLTFGKIITLTQ